MADPILTWRGNPRENLADWTLEVRVVQQKDSQAPFPTNHEEITTYHVHRIKLAHASPRFLQWIRDAAEPKTELELPESEARVVPDTLDFLYGVANIIQDDNAVDLYTLAKSWELTNLQTSVRSFWKSRLQWQNLLEYCEMFRPLMDDSLLSMLAQVCADNFEKLQRNHGLLATASISLWPKVLEIVQQRMPPKKVGRIWVGLLIPMLYRRYLDIPYFDANVFYEFTQERYIPDICDTHVAWTLLKIAVQILSDDMAASLRERCVKCLVEHWCDLDITPEEEFPDPVRETLEMHSSTFLVALCARLLSRAKQTNPNGSVVVSSKDNNARASEPLNASAPHHWTAAVFQQQTESTDQDLHDNPADSGQQSATTPQQSLSPHVMGATSLHYSVNPVMDEKRVNARRSSAKILEIEEYTSRSKEQEPVSLSLRFSSNDSIMKKTSQLQKKKCLKQDVNGQKAINSNVSKESETRTKSNNPSGTRTAKGTSEKILQTNNQGSRRRRRSRSLVSVTLTSSQSTKQVHPKSRRKRKR